MKQIKESDLVNTPEWLKIHFKNHYDPCPENPKIDGLKTNWKNPSFVNPPYSDPLSWVKKAIEENKKGVSVVMLLKVDPSTKWYKLLVEHGSHFAYFNERISFIHQKKGEYKSSNNFCNMLIYLEGKK